MHFSPEVELFLFTTIKASHNTTPLFETNRQLLLFLQLPWKWEGKGSTRELMEETRWDVMVETLEWDWKGMGSGLTQLGHHGAVTASLL